MAAPAAWAAGLAVLAVLAAAAGAAGAAPPHAPLHLAAAPPRAPRWAPQYRVRGPGRAALVCFARRRPPARRLAAGQALGRALAPGRGAAAHCSRFALFTIYPINFDRCSQCLGCVTLYVLVPQRQQCGGSGTAGWGGGWCLMRVRAAAGVLGLGHPLH